MKAKKKIIICCNSKERATIKKQLKELSTNQQEARVQDLGNEDQIQLMERLSQKVESLEKQKEAVLQEAIIQGKVTADDAKTAENIFAQAVRRGVIKFDDTIFEECLQGYKKAEIKDWPAYESFKRIRDKFGDFDGNNSKRLVELRKLLDEETKTLSKTYEKVSKRSTEFVVCCDFEELDRLENKNLYDGLVVPCELNWSDLNRRFPYSEFNGITLVQRLREKGLVIPIVFTSVHGRVHMKYIIDRRKDAEIIRTPALQHRFVDGLAGWDAIIKTFDEMRCLNQGELAYTQMLYCSLRGVLLQIKHSIKSSSNKDKYKHQIRYVLEKQFNGNEELIEEFNQTDNLELFCQKLIELIDNPEIVQGSIEKDGDFVCKDDQEQYKIVYLEDNMENDDNARRFVDYIKAKNTEVEEMNAKLKDEYKEKKKKHPEIDEKVPKKKFIFAPPLVVTSKEALERCYKPYQVIIVDIDIKNKNEEVVALGFEVVRHLIEDLQALSHAYYIVTNVTRSFYDQIKIPGVKRIRLKEEVFGTEDRIERFLYGIKEALESKQSPTSDCRFIFEKLDAYTRNETNYPIDYKFNYMKEKQSIPSFHELEELVRNETLELIKHFLLNCAKQRKDYGDPLEEGDIFDVFDDACKLTQAYIGAKDTGKLGRGNGKLVPTMMKNKNDVPTSANVNAFIVRLILRRFFLYVREFIRNHRIDKIGEMLYGDDHNVTEDDLACRAINGTKGAYKEYEESGSNQSKCLTETLMLTEESTEKLEEMLTEEEKKYIDEVKKEAFAFDFSSEQKIKNLSFNH